MGGEGGEPASEIGCEAAETSRSKQASEKKQKKCSVQWSNSKQFKIAILVNIRPSKLSEMQNNQFEGVEIATFINSKEFNFGNF